MEILLIGGLFLALKFFPARVNAEAPPTSADPDETNIELDQSVGGRVMPDMTASEDLYPGALDSRSPVAGAGPGRASSPDPRSGPEQGEAADSDAPHVVGLTGKRTAGGRRKALRMNKNMRAVLDVAPTPGKAGGHVLSAFEVR